MSIESLFPIYTYPTNSVTDKNFMMSSLGSFWNQIFREKSTVQGYSQGVSEETIQSYYNLLQALDVYSVQSTPVLHTEKYYPLVIKQSEFNQERFVFESNGAVFGQQPESDQIYRGVTFQFGEPKIPSRQVWLYQFSDTLKTCSLFANRVIDPSRVLTNGVDFKFDGNILLFNTNLFEDDLFPKVEVRDELGNVTDQQIILWGYMAGVDEHLLHDYHGYIFDLNLNSSEDFKNLLVGYYRAYTNGPTVANIQSLLSMGLGVIPIIEAQETIEAISEDAYHKLVITDKNVYRIDKSFTLANLTVGQALYAGDILITNIQYFDNVCLQGWWRTLSNYGIQNLALNKYMFLGNYQSQLVFKNDFEIIYRDSDGFVNFPVTGSPEDVSLFEQTINDNNINQYLNLGLGETQIINPVDFLFTNLLKENTAAFIFDVNSKNSELFFRVLPDIAKLVPRHVYMIAFINFEMEGEGYDKLNSSWVYNNVDDTNADYSIGGTLIADIEADYKDIDTYGFTISLTPDTLDEAITGNDITPSNAGFQDGSEFLTGPHVIPVNATTETYRTLLLGDF